MTMFRRLFSIMALLVLAACGGAGGDGGSPFGGSVPGGGGGDGGTDGTSSGSSVALSLSSPTVTPQTPSTLTVTVRDAAGAPVLGVVVALATTRTDIGQLSAVSVLTNAAGIGTAQVRSASTGVVGADEITATASLGTTTVGSRIGYEVTGAAETVRFDVPTTTTLSPSVASVDLSVQVLNSAGSPVPGQVVSFGSAIGRVTLSTTSALTDSSGRATTRATASSFSAGVADTVVASTTVNGRELQATQNLQVIAATPTIQVNTSSPSSSTTSPATVTATVRNSVGQPVADTVVNFTTQFDLGAYSAVTARTNASGQATVVLSPRQATTVGADFAVATATVDGVTRSGQSVIDFVGTAVIGNPTLTVTLSNSTVTAATPSDVTATLRDGAGNAIRGAVIGLSTQRGNLASLSAASVLTGDNGAAGALLRTTASGADGADEVVATATVGGTQIQGRVGFTVVAQSPTISLPPPDNPLRFSSPPVDLVVTVRNASGQGVKNQLVSFAAENGLVRLSAASTLTDTTGTATVAVSAVSASTSGAEVITATTTANGRELQARANLQVESESPAIDIVAPIAGSSVSAIAPVTMRTTVRNAAGKLLQGAVVSFTSLSNLAAFAPATQVTDSNGEATTVISPRTPESAGAETITASVTVQGVTATSQRVLQFASSAPTGTPTLDLILSTTSISAAAPANVNVTLLNAQGQGVGGQVVTFDVLRGLATTNIGTALTKTDGTATVVLSPASSTAAGADEITASASYAGVPLQKVRGFEVQATPVTLGALSTADNPLSAYGQTTLTLPINGASVTSPVNISVTSSCVAQGKATLSPATFTATSSTATMQYRDNGCGAVQVSDQIQAVVNSTGTSASLSLAIRPPAESSVAFVQAAPEAIFLRGSGFTESSVVTFEVRDAAGNPLPGRVVELRLQTGAGGVTMEGRGVESIDPPSPAPFTQISNALGRVSVRVNSGTLPTPVRINARLQGSNPVIATVSSNLSVAVGLPSQLNFSLSQGTKNIEGYNIDGTPNTYQIIAADRSGNPVPAGTSINFVTEGGQIEAIKQTQLVNGIARTTANFVSSEPRPVDGRVTITSYALGEESFLDTNGNNVRDAGESFQDLGNIFKDRNFDGIYGAAVDEFVPLEVNNASVCAAPGNNLLLLDASIPSMPATCDGAWSGAGQVYARRATETVLSTSAARPLWASTSGLDASCRKITLQVGPNPNQTAEFTLVAGDTWYGGSSGTLSFRVGDANPGSLAQGLPPRLNPMAAGTVISASTPTTGLTVTLGGGSPVPSTTEASLAAVAYSFTDATVDQGVIFVTFRSPSNTGTTVSVTVVRGAAPSACAP